MTEKIYLEDGNSCHSLFAGNLSRNLVLAGQMLQLTLVARDAWVQIEGDEEAIKRGTEFLHRLSELKKLRGGKLDQADFEQVLRAGRDRKSSDLSRLFASRLRVSPKKREIIPRTAAQLDYLEQIRNKDVVFGIGPAGTGKTYLAMAMAVSEFLAGNVSRIILTRPAKEAGENLGFLPGNLEEKIMPYLRPLYDALYDMLDVEEAATLIARRTIEVAPLAFMRGRTLNHAFIILDEAQNTTVEQMLMFLTRMGYHSRCVITGDPSQTDLGKNEHSGLKHAEKTLSKVEEIGFCYFNTADVVRHALLEKIINAYTGEDKRG